MYLSNIKKHYKLLKYPRLFRDFYILNLYKIFTKKIFKKSMLLERAKRKGRVEDRPLLSNENFNSEIKNAIFSGKPFFCCRYGSCELTASFYGLMKEMGVLDAISFPLMKNLKTNAGVFPEDEKTYMTFANEYMNSLPKADYNAYLGFALMEEYMIHKFVRKDCAQYAMRALEPFQYEKPWTLALKNKRVLIVHPFAELIESQYKRRNEIFPDKEIFPECELRVVKAIQSSGKTYPEGYADWTEALDSLYQSCMKEDFDIALLSCGSYAVPLGARLNESGKQVMVLGGMLQIMFGIKGKRWEESRPDIVAMYNDAWIRADGSYVVKDAEKIDGAAYW